MSYDALGWIRFPSTQVAYTPGTEPALFLGRGYTGHEHLPWFGLINMNARLYDAALGRFLSPDPYVQMPDFSQNFNLYSYCLNNPLKWAWNPLSWSKPKEVVFHFGSNTDGSGLYGGISAGKPGQPQPMVVFSRDQGAGMGYNYNGNSNMYYPGYDYNKLEKNVNVAIYQARQNYNNANPSSVIAGATTGIIFIKTTNHD